MKRFRNLVLLSSAIVCIPVAVLQAEVKTEEKSVVKFEGFMGGVMGLFGGKAAKEGILSTVAVRGNRKATINDTTGEIIDLDEEKVYALDRARFLTVNHELLKAVASASESDTAIPAGFKEKEQAPQVPQRNCRSTRPALVSAEK